MKIQIKTNKVTGRKQLVIGSKGKDKGVKTAKTGKTGKKVKAAKVRGWTAQAWRAVRELDSDRRVNLCNMRAGDAGELQIVATKGQGELKTWLVWGRRGERSGTARFTGTIAHLDNGMGVDFKTFKHYELGAMQKIVGLVKANGVKNDAINYDSRTFKGHVLKTQGDFYTVFTDGKNVFNLQLAGAGHNAEERKEAQAERFSYGGATK